MMHHRILPVFAAVLLFMAPVAHAAQTVTVTTPAGETHVFHMDVAKTPSESERGLMFRTEMALDAGMLFPFNPPQQIYFWMKNTLIPLDMVFIAPGGRVSAVHAMAKPMDLTPISSQGPVAGVMEINGGRAAALGIGPGSTVSPPPEQWLAAK